MILFVLFIISYMNHGGLLFKLECAFFLNLSLSSGLCTCTSAWLDICVYRCVVLTLVCPINSWMYLISYPSSSKCVPKECLSMCWWTGFWLNIICLFLIWQNMKITGKKIFIIFPVGNMPAPHRLALAAFSDRLLAYRLPTRLYAVFILC